MQLLITQLWKLCIFQSSPSDLPASNFLLALLLVFNAALTITFNLIFNPVSALAAISAVMIGLTANALLLWGLLHLLSMPNRFTQTFSAMLGVDIILTSLTFVASIFIYENGEPKPDSPIAILLLLLIWTLAAYTYILQKALNVHLFLAAFITFFMFLFSIAISQVATGGT